MMAENEVVMFVLGLGVLLFTIIYRTNIERIPECKILILSFRFVLVGWLLTVLEGFFFTNLFNYLEHACYSLSSVLLAYWVWKYAYAKNKEG